MSKASLNFANQNHSEKLTEADLEQISREWQWGFSLEFFIWAGIAAVGMLLALDFGVIAGIVNSEKIGFTILTVEMVLFVGRMILGGLHGRPLLASILAVGLTFAFLSLTQSCGRDNPHSMHHVIQEKKAALLQGAAANQPITGDHQHGTSDKSGE